MITNKVLAEITWDDIDQLIAEKVEEGINLEFKSGAIFEKEPNRSKTHARDEIAEAIVAFANTYGGMVVAGISEDNKNKDCANGLSLVPEVLGQMSRLENAINSIIDPPIAGVEFRALTSGEDETSGVILVRVPSSLLAPHGFGAPPKAYVRRGKSSVPMTMRDLQSVFWEARTRVERVRDIRAAADQSLQEFRKDMEQGRLRDRDGQNVDPAQPGLFMRATAIMTQPLNPQGLTSNRIRFLRPMLPTDSYSPFGVEPPPVCRRLQLPNRMEPW